MVLKECGFGYLKIDYNDTIGMGCDGGDSLGDGLYRKVEASRRFFEKIRQEVPGIVIENCSSGRTPFGTINDAISQSGKFF